MMHSFRRLLQAVCLLSAASTGLGAWTFSDGTISLQTKGAGVASSPKEKLTPNSPLAKPLNLASADTLKIILTTHDGSTAKKANQVFLLLEDSESNLDISYPFSVKDSGKAALSLTLKDLPSQFTRSTAPVSASLVIASFGPSAGYKAPAFSLTISPDSAIPTSERPLRYGKLRDIHHVFRPDPKSPPAIISLGFAIAALTTLPVLFGSWLYLGGNVNHVQKALADAPISHLLFVGSIIGVEGVLFLYYTSWRLFTALPVLGVLGVVAVISGSRALTEVQERRLAGLR